MTSRHTTYERTLKDGLKFSDGSPPISDQRQTLEPPTSRVR